MINFIRFIVFSRQKFTLYMRSGNVLKFTAKSAYQFTKPGMSDKSWKYSFDRMRPAYNIDWSQVEAVKVQ